MTMLLQCLNDVNEKIIFCFILFFQQDNDVPAKKLKKSESEVELNPFDLVTVATEISAHHPTPL